MEIATLFLQRLLFLHRDGVRFGVGIPANAGYLPGDFHVRLVGANHEAILLYLRSDDGPSELSEYGELVAEIPTSFWHQ